MKTIADYNYCIPFHSRFFSAYEIWNGIFRDPKVIVRIVWTGRNEIYWLFILLRRLTTLRACFVPTGFVFEILVEIIALVDPKWFTISISFGGRLTRRRRRCIWIRQKKPKIDCWLQFFKKRENENVESIVGRRLSRLAIDFIETACNAISCGD